MSTDDFYKKLLGKELIDKYSKINKSFENGEDIDPELTKDFITFPINNYVHVEPNSHFYTDLNQLIHSIEIAKDNSIEYIDFDYILIGLKNTLEQGYNLKKQIKEDI